MTRLVDEAEHLSHNQNTSVASLRLLFGFTPESLFDLPPECCSDSSESPLVGQSLSSEADAVMGILSHQVIGGLYLSEGYGRVLALIHSVIPKARGLSLGLPDPKRLLQEHATRARSRPPQYRLLREEGPDHCKEFHVRLSVGPNLHTEGVGRSIKEAERSAAEAWLRRYAPQSMAIQVRRPAPVESSELSRTLSLSHLPLRWQAEFRNLAELLGFSADCLGNLAEALTHRSYRLIAPGVRDYSVHSQLGSAVLEAAVTDLMNDRPAEDTRLPKAHFYKIKAILVSKPFVAGLSKQLALPSLLLVGRGQPTDVETIESDVLQAVLGAAYLCSRPPTRVTEVLPRILRDMFSQEIAAHIGGLRPLGNYKSFLQELLQPIQVYVSYECSESSGPEHAPTFSAKCAVGCRASGQQVVVHGGTGTSIKSAQTELAERVVMVLREVNAGAKDLDQAVASSPPLARFFLTHGVRFAPTAPSWVKLWWDQGLLCSAALKAGRLDLFSNWLRKVTTLLEQSGESLTDLSNIAEFLRQARQLRTRPLEERYHEALVEVEKIVRHLDPEKDAGDTQASKGFKTLLGTC